MRLYKDQTPSDKQYSLLTDLVTDDMHVSSLVSKIAFAKNLIGQETFVSWDNLLWSRKYPLVTNREDGSLTTSHLTKHCSFFGVYQILDPASGKFIIVYIGESGSGATKQEGDSKGTSIKDRLNSHFTDIRDGKPKFLSMSSRLELLEVRFMRLDRIVVASFEAWLIKKYEPICNSKGKITIL
tara:strand:- start:371 stop:919 length:549 start_codon:yes stop_codon:yes gene_type:complete